MVRSTGSVSLQVTVSLQQIEYALAHHRPRKRRLRVVLKRSAVSTPIASSDKTDTITSASISAVAVAMSRYAKPGRRSGLRSTIRIPVSGACRNS